jgi:mutator family transposase
LHALSLSVASSRNIATPRSLSQDGVRITLTDGRRELLVFARAKSESQNGWEGLLNDLFQRGLPGQHLQLVITDGCPGLARAFENGVSTRTPSALLGAQDAQHLGENKTARRILHKQLDVTSGLDVLDLQMFRALSHC